MERPLSEMRNFRRVLLLLLAVLVVYTVMVIVDHGFGLLPVFFGDIAAMGWPGQFNLDFMIMLFLSAWWTAWRNSYAPTGLFLAVLAFFFGAGFLLTYLIFLTFRHEGDMREVLLGENLASGRVP